MWGLRWVTLSRCPNPERKEDGVLGLGKGKTCPGAEELLFPSWTLQKDGEEEISSVRKAM